MAKNERILTIIVAKDSKDARRRASKMYKKSSWTVTRVAFEEKTKGGKRAYIVLGRLKKNADPRKARHPGGIGARRD